MTADLHQDVKEALVEQSRAFNYADRGWPMTGKLIGFLANISSEAANARMKKAGYTPKRSGSGIKTEWEYRDVAHELGLGVVQ